MYRNKRIVAIIPARQGSKRLKEKNLLLLGKRPLIAWSIEQAKRSRYLDRIIVSTDSQEIAEISKAYGAEIPFLRPSFLSTDRAKTEDVLLHAINWLEERQQSYEVTVLLQPTSPLRTSEDIDSSIELLFSKRAKAIVSVCQTEYPSFWCNRLSKNKGMKNFMRKEREDNRLSKFYRLNGAIYVVFSDYFKRYKRFFGNRTFAYIMSQENSIDIDTELDLKFAEFLLESRSSHR